MRPTTRRGRGCSGIGCDDVTHNDGSNDTFLVKQATVPSGGSLVVVGGDQKVVLQTGDSIKVTSSAASSCDVMMSILEIT